MSKTHRQCMSLMEKNEEKTEFRTFSWISLFSGIAVGLTWSCKECCRSGRSWSWRWEPSHSGSTLPSRSGRTDLGSRCDQTPCDLEKETKTGWVRDMRQRNSVFWSGKGVDTTPEAKDLERPPAKHRSFWNWGRTCTKTALSVSIELGRPRLNSRAKTRLT